MIGAKHIDPVVGVDIHITNLPTPGGPVPTPLPNPFIGMVLDPMDYAPFVGATVIVNGSPVGVAGTEARNSPPGHIPIAGPFVKPPDDEGEIFMGSMTVTADGEPFSYTGLPVLSCSDIGAPGPPRAKKGASKTLSLPTSVVLSVPMGMPVMVGGPPTISMMGMAMKFGFAALGKAFAKLKKIDAVANAIKKGSDKIHDLARKAMKKLGIPPNIMDKVHKKICSITGHPVDIASGMVFTEITDFELPGPVPLVFERTWYSSSVFEGSLGRGWHHNYDIAMIEDKEERICALRMEDDRAVIFPLLAEGEDFYDRKEKLSISRDEKGYLVRDKERRYYRFHQDRENIWPLASISNSSGRGISFDYDERGALKQITDSAGRILTIDTDAGGRILAIHAPHPDYEAKTFPIMRFEYDKGGHMTRAIDALNHAYQYEYKNHLLVKEINRNGLSFYFEYDGTDHGAKCYHTWGDDGIYNHKLTYLDGLTIVENSLGYKRKHYHKDGLVYKEIDPLGHAKEFEYNEFNELMAEVDQLGYRTEYGYDERGNRTRILYPDDTKLAMNYSEEDLLMNAVDKVGGKWSWNYDDRMFLISEIDCMGSNRTFTYDKQGSISHYINPMGGTTYYGYDEYYNTIQYTTPNNATSRWEFDRLGRLKFAIDPKGNRREVVYDLMGRIVKEILPDGNIRLLTYDPEGNIIEAEDNQNKVRYEYMGMGRIKLREQAGAQLRYKYNTEEQLIGIVNENGKTFSFSLNGNGEVDIESSFENIQRVFYRDAKGRIVKTLKASGIEALYEYDNMDRLLKIKNSDGGFLKYFYRQDGEIIEVENSSGVVHFEKDLLGKVTLEAQNEHYVISKYDKLEVRTYLESSLGTKLSISRDAIGFVTGIDAEIENNNWTASYERDILGNELKRVTLGKINNLWKLDNLGRPIGHIIEQPGQQITHSREYIWDINDRLKSFTDFGERTTTFSHDKLGYLISERDSKGKKIHREADPVGNLFRKNYDQIEKYGIDGQILQKGDDKFKYDFDGNLIEKTDSLGKRWTYKWDDFGVLRQVIPPDNEQISFTYDGLGRRITKASGNLTTFYVWDGNNIIHEWQEEIEANNGSSKKFQVDAIQFREKEKVQESKDQFESSDFILIKEKNISQLEPLEIEGQEIFAQENEKINLTTWIFEPESMIPIGKIVNGKSYSIHTNHIGFPIQVNDEAGRLVWSAECNIYGEVVDLKGDKSFCPFRYPGQYEDVETGLYYNRFRYYNPKVGAFISKDPSRTNSWIRLYGYVFDTNTGYDPFGLNSTVLNKNLGGVVGDEMQAHHVIPEQVWKENQDMFDDLGMEMDHKDNGVLLPDSESKRLSTGHEVYHRGSHPQYNDAVRQDVQKVKADWESGKISDAKAKKKLEGIQKKWKKNIDTGKAPLSPKSLAKGCKKLG